MKKLWCVVLTAAMGLSAHAAAKGSCESKADSIKIGGSKRVSLVNEYDPEEKEYFDDGGYYLAVTLSRGKGYTVWIEGDAASDIDLSCYAREPTESEWDKDIFGPSADFGGSEDFGTAQACYLSEEDWDYEEDPASWKYYIYLSGSINASVTVGIVEGYKSFVPLGSEENPKVINFGTNEASDAESFGEGDFYYAANLTAGRKYLLRTTGGTEEAPLGINVESEDVDVEDDGDYASDKNNTALILYPQTTGRVSFSVSGAGADFGIRYKMVGTRAITAHPVKDLALGSSASVKPGPLNASNAFYDEIVDNNLFKVTLEKGERAVFRTEFANESLKLYVYDSKGNVLVTNTSIGNGSADVLAALEATAKGVYYVGLCDPDLETGATPSEQAVLLSAIRVTAKDGDPDEWDAADDTTAGASALSPVPATEDDDPTMVGVAHGPHRLSATDWADCFQIGGRKDITYAIGTAYAEEDSTDLSLKAEVFTLSGSSERAVVSGLVSPGEDPLTFKATANATYYVRLTIAEGFGLDYPAYNVFASAYSTSGEALGILQVETKGAPGLWTLDRESVKYAGGVSILAAGEHTVTFQTVKGFAFQGSTKVAVSIKPGSVPTLVTGVYSDTFDPKDNAFGGATKLNVSNKELVSDRTLWAADPADWFSFAAKDGVFYNFALRNVSGDAKMRLLDSTRKTVIAESDKAISKQPLVKGNYYLVVEHGEKTPVDGQYALVSSSANVGAIKFAKNAVSVKEDAAYVELTVNRTAKEGVVRVKYGTVAGTAKPGVDYVAQTGVLEWPNNNSAAQKIRIPLIPDVVAEYEGNKTFQVQLLPFEEDELEDGEYRAAFAGGTSADTVSATVTLTETARQGVSPYKPVKAATVKTETVPLYVGSFSGVLVEDGSALTNGFPAVGSIAFTASAADALSAKVTIAGKTYTFSAKGWDDADDAYGAYKEFTGVTKVGADSYENTLRVTLNGGRSDDGSSWRTAGGTAELVLNVPDANNKGVQESISYVAELVRDNAKIQDYLKAVVDYAGYYTVALIPEGVSTEDGVPAGNGYLTMTIDNKGKAKIAGLLADGTTKPTYTTSVAVQDDGSLLVPVMSAKSPYAFGGAIRIFMQQTEDSRLPYERTPVVDSSGLLVWNNDNAALTRDGLEGWRQLLVPAGGWYDTVLNLQSYYLTRAFMLDGVEVTVSGNNLTVPKNSAGETASAITFTYKRATGLTSGTLTYDGTKSIKHNGIMLLSRDAAAPLDPDVLAPGAFTRQVSVTEKNAQGRLVTRKWIESIPFDLRATDEGEPDWWADDWGDID